MNRQPDFSDPRAWILYSDEDLVVVNKPAGLLSIPDGYHPQLPHLSQALAPLMGKLWIVHRLDKETSGVMLVARSAEAHRILNQSFRERALSKLYHCLAAPGPDWQTKNLDLPLRVNADRAHRTRVDLERGKPARTLVQVLKSGERFSLLECALFSGYTHQIRAHLYYAGLGLLGDSLYQPKGVDNFDERLRAERVLLHAYEIGFTHPLTGQKLSFRAPYPPDFQEKLNDH